MESFNIYRGFRFNLKNFNLIESYLPILPDKVLPYNSESVWSTNYNNIMESIQNYQYGFISSLTIDYNDIKSKVGEYIILNDNRVYEPKIIYITFGTEALNDSDIYATIEHIVNYLKNIIYDDSNEIICNNINFLSCLTNNGIEYMLDPYLTYILIQNNYDRSVTFIIHGLLYSIEPKKQLNIPFDSLENIQYIFPSIVTQILNYDINLNNDLSSTIRDKQIQISNKLDFKLSDDDSLNILKQEYVYFLRYRYVLYNWDLFYNPITKIIESFYNLSPTYTFTIRNLSLYFDNFIDDSVIKDTIDKIKKINDENSCINKNITFNDKTIPYFENGEIYCFSISSINNLLEYQLNPYSGRILTEEFIKELDPNVEYKGDYLSSLCIEKSINLKEEKLSPETDKWLFSYISGIFMANIYPYIIPIKIRIELAKYRSCKEQDIYRGIHFGRNNIEIIKDYLPMKIGDKKKIKFNKLSSWSYNNSIANIFANKNSYGFTMKLTPKLEDIFVDIDYIEKHIWEYKMIHLMNEEEIIILPGEYEVEIIYINSIESLNNPEVYENIVSLAKLTDLDKLDNYCNISFHSDFLICFSNKGLEYIIDNDLTNINISNKLDKDIEFDNKIYKPGDDVFYYFDKPSDLVDFVENKLIPDILK